RALFGPSSAIVSLAAHAADSQNTSKFESAEHGEKPSYCRPRSFANDCNALQPITQPEQPANAGQCLTISKGWAPMTQENSARNPCRMSPPITPDVRWRLVSHANRIR